MYTYDCRIQHTCFCALCCIKKPTSIYPVNFFCRDSTSHVALFTPFVLLNICIATYNILLILIMIETFRKKSEIFLDKQV